MAKYFVRRGKKVFGPVSGEQMVGLAKSGKVQPSDEIATDKNGSWQPTTALAPLKAVFQQARAGPLGPVNADPLGIGPEHETPEEGEDEVPLGKSRFDLERGNKKRKKQENLDASETEPVATKSSGFLGSLKGVMRALDFFGLFANSDD